MHDRVLFVHLHSKGHKNQFYSDRANLTSEMFNQKPDKKPS